MTPDQRFSAVILTLFAADCALYGWILGSEAWRAVRAWRHRRWLARHGRTFLELNAVLKDHHSRRVA